MDYEKMTDKELQEEMNTLEENFNGYKNLLQEVYDNMCEMSEKYAIIQEILKNRNGK